MADLLTLWHLVQNNTVLLAIPIIIFGVLSNWAWLKSLVGKVKLPAWPTRGTVKTSASPDAAIALMRELRVTFKDKPEALAAVKKLWAELLEIGEA